MKRVEAKNKDKKGKRKRKAKSVGRQYSVMSVGVEDWLKDRLLQDDFLL